MALPAPFVSVNRTAGFVPAGPLNNKLKDRLTQSKFKDAFQNMGIALADLTDIPEGPDPKQSFAIAFAAANAKVETELAVGSLTKIAPMFAAFYLRERVKAAAAAVGANAQDTDDVVAQIAADWTTLVSNRISKTPSDFPKLKKIFNFSPAAPWEPRFNDGKRTLQALDAFHNTAKPVIDTLEFGDRMKLAIRFSDNLGAGSCARDVGFQYMNGALAEEGFADNKRNGILWLGGDFGYETNPPIMGAPPWDTTKGATWVRANAKGIASFFTLVWTNRLVNERASPVMRNILKEPGGVGLGTFLANNTPDRVASWGKIGLLTMKTPTGGDTSSISEGVIVESNTGGKTIRYAGVGLTATSEDVMKELAGIFHQCIKELH
jgi:hypothetical protein